MTATRIDEWRTWMQAQGDSENTWKARTRRVELFARTLLDTAPEDATTGQVVGYIAGLRVGKSTRATYHSHLKAWFLWLVKSGYRDDNPMDRMKAPRTPRRQPRPVTARELAAILAVPVRRRARMMVYLAAFQGLRCHEIAKMRGEDVNLKDGELTVRGKGEVKATVPLRADVADLARAFPPRGYWFPTYHGNATGDAGPMLAKSVSHCVSEVFKRAGVSGGAHRLRHWHGTEMLRLGADVRVVQTLLRHASLATTALYTEVDREQQRAAIDLLQRPDVA